MTHASSAATPETDRLAWWREARFGMFIHFGLYSMPGRGEWIFYQEHVPVEEYGRLADAFDPRHYEPAEWVAVARDAGMRYCVLTTRHHDGFCLFDSAASDFTAPKRAAGRDLVAEFVEACRAAGMRIGFYYSLVDWRFGLLNQGKLPDDAYEPMVWQAHEQVRELMTNYGPIDILWYDGCNPPDPAIWRSDELNLMVRSLQPEVIINNRAAVPADFGTPENTVRAEERAWEACYTMNETWGYAPGDRNWKSVNQLLFLLASCVSQGGNLLLNVGPDGEGRFPPEAVEYLRQVGGWMRTNGQAVYQAERSPVPAPALGWSTLVGDRVYLIVLRWPGSVLPFAWCGSRVRSARLLADGRRLRVEQSGDRVWLRDLPEEPPGPYLSVIELTFDGAPKASDPAYR